MAARGRGAGPGIGLVEDRPSLGIEGPAERTGETGQFLGLLDPGRVGEDDAPECILGAVEFGLATAELLGLANHPGLETQDGEPIDRLAVAGGALDQEGQLPALGLAVTVSGGEPGSHRADCGGIEVGIRQV